MTTKAIGYVRVSTDKQTVRIPGQAEQHSGASRTGFRAEAEQHSGVKPNRIPGWSRTLSGRPRNAVRLAPECFPQVAALDINAG